MNPDAGQGPLGHALLDVTEPPPGLAHRVLAGFPTAGPRARRGPRVEWALGALAVLLTVATVAALLVVRQPAVARPAARPPAVPAIPPPAAAIQPPPPVSAGGVAAAAFTTASTGWIAQRNGVSSTTDGGRHWTTHPQPAPGAGILGVWTAPGGVVLTVTQRLLTGGPGPAMPVFWRSTDGGAQWQELEPPGGNGTWWGPLWVEDANRAWLVTQTMGLDPVATVLRTADGGRTWHAQATFHVKAVLGRYEVAFQGNLLFLDSGRGILATGGRTGPEFHTEPPSVLVTKDGGAHWSKVVLPEAPPGIDSTNQGGLYAFPTAGGEVALVLGRVPPRGPVYVYTTADGGQHWSGPRALPASDASFFSEARLTALDDGHWWWATGTDVYFSSDQGRHWSARGALPRPEQLVDLRFTSPTDGWARAANIAGNASNTLFTTADGGRTWTGVPPPDPIHVRAGCDTTPAPVTYRVHLSELTQGGISYPPAGVGVTSGCRYWLSTHDGSGVIDVALPPAQKDTTLTLGDFLDLWAFAYQPPPGQPLLVYVNGQPYQGDPRTIPLRPHADIVVEPEGATSLQPPVYPWPPGQ